MVQSRVTVLYVKRDSGIYRKHFRLEESERTLCGAVIGRFRHVHIGPIKGTIIECEKCAMQESKLSKLENRLRSKY